LNMKNSGMRPIQRMTGATLDVLEVLLHANEGLHGFAISKAARRPAGSTYNVLERLEAAGLVTSWWEEQNPQPGRPRRRFYRLTPNSFGWVATELAKREHQQRLRARRLRLVTPPAAG
jgi:PadR family transcriptional regulator, regulatory protein PadR